MSVPRAALQKRECSKIFITMTVRRRSNLGFAAEGGEKSQMPSAFLLAPAKLKVCCSSLANDFFAFGSLKQNVCLFARCKGCVCFAGKQSGGVGVN